MSFTPGDWVWVKRPRLPWWPAVVVRKEDLPEPPKTKKSIVACVKYVPGQQYDSITNSAHIKHFNCPEMEDLITKGDALKRSSPYLKLEFDKSLKTALRRSPEVKDGLKMKCPTASSHSPCAAEIATGYLFEGTSPNYTLQMDTSFSTSTRSNTATCTLTKDSDSKCQQRSYCSVKMYKRNGGRNLMRSHSLSPARHVDKQQVAAFSTPEGTPSKSINGKRARNSDVSLSHSAGSPKKLMFKRKRLKLVSTSGSSIQPTDSVKNSTSDMQKGAFDMLRASQSSEDRVGHVDKSCTNEASGLPTDLTVIGSEGQKKASCKSDCDNNVTKYVPLYHKSESTLKVETAKTEVKQSSNTNSDSDSDSDLPAFSQELTDRDVHKGDIVWAKYGTHPFWPAVVKSLYKREKNQRITLVFLGPLKWRHYRFSMKNDKKCIRPFDVAFNDLEKNGVGTNFQYEIQEAIDQVTEYLVKKALDPETKDALDYFLGREDDTVELEAENFDHADGTHPFLSPNGQLEEHEDEASSGNGEESEGTTSGCEEGPAADACDTNQNTCVKMSSKLSKSIELRRTKNQKLVDFIKTEKTKMYVLRVVKGEVDSKWREEFLAGPSCRQEFQERRRAHWFGPICDEDHVDEVTNAMLSCGKEVQNNDINYIIEVLVPEAIVFALIRVRRLTKTKAIEVFEKGPKSFKEERKNNLEEFVQHLKKNQKA